MEKIIHEAMLEIMNKCTCAPIHMQTLYTFLLLCSNRKSSESLSPSSDYFIVTLQRRDTVITETNL
jgi:hypothetical protein